MKTTKFAIACLCFAAMVSCQKENMVQTAGRLSFKVTTEVPGSESKAALSGTSVVFNAGDAISVFDGVSNNKFTTADGGATALFSGSAAEAERYVLVSPYNESVTVKGSVITYEIPDVQTATPDGVDPKALISGALLYKGNEVELFNAVGLVKVEVPAGLQVRNIQVAGGYGQNTAVAGTFEFNPDTKNIGIPDVNNTTTVITLVPQDGEEFIAEGTYYVAIRPKTTYDGGFTVAYVNELNQLCKRQTRNAADIKRSHILPLGTLNTTDFTAVTGTATLRYAGEAPQFTGGIKKMAGGSGSPTEVDNSIKKIVFKAHTLYSQAYKIGANVMSNGPASTIEIHAYIKGDVVYVCTEAPYITLHATSGNLFRDFAALETVEFNDVNAQPGTSFTYMFRNDQNLLSVDFGNADFSNVTDMSYMFVTNKLERVSFGKTSTAKVTTMQSMFSQSLNLRYLYLGPNFTLAPNVTGMFNGTASNTTQQKDAEGHGLQCKLHASQAVWDALCTDLNADGVNAVTLFNKNRFFFTPAE